MDGRTYGAWMKAGLDIWMLGAEAGAVIALRLAKIATGGAAGNEEAALMVTEKIRAMLEVQVRLATGSFGPTALGNVQGVTSHYRKRVSANSRRLSR